MPKNCRVLPVGLQHRHILRERKCRWHRRRRRVLEIIQVCDPDKNTTFPAGFTKYLEFALLCFSGPIGPPETVKLTPVAGHSGDRYDYVPRRRSRRYWRKRCSSHSNLSVSLSSR